jgi:hypothetical protein
VIEHFEEQIINLRLKVLNAFCLKISKIPLLNISEEVELFFDQNRNFASKINDFKQKTNEELIQKYKEYYPSLKTEVR